MPTAGPRLRKRRSCNLSIFSETARNRAMCFASFAAALFISNHREAFSAERAANTLQARLIPADLVDRRSLNVTNSRPRKISRGPDLESSCRFCFEPIRTLASPGSATLAAPLGNEIRAQTNLCRPMVLRSSYLLRAWNVCSLSGRNLLSRPRVFRLWPMRRVPAVYSMLTSAVRPSGFRWRLIFALTIFGFFRHRLIGVDRFHPFNALRRVGKRFLALR